MCAYEDRVFVHDEELETATENKQMQTGNLK